MIHPKGVAGGTIHLKEGGADGIVYLKEGNGRWDDVSKREEGQVG